jgi:hypothetical protein
MLRPLLATIAVVLVTAASPALGEQKGTAADVARLTVPRETWAQGVQTIAQDAQGRLQSHPGKKLQYPPEFEKKVRAEVEAVLPYDELIGMHAKELSARFTEAELEGLLAFYRTPAGQKYLKVMPAVSESVSKQTEQRFQQKMPEVMQRLAKLSTTQAPAGNGSPKKPGR